MTVLDLCKFIENEVPLRFQEGYDNCGLQIGNYENDVNGVLISIDVTEEIIDLNDTFSV